ncbi:MAG: hypothetical protein Fur0022_25070 [Anaerolineales bacterium]
MSYYIVTTDNLYGLGYKRGQEYEAQSVSQNGIVILDFGNPYHYNGNYGVILLDYYNWPVVKFLFEIKDASKQFAEGFWYGLGVDNASFLTIVVGTNNSGSHVTQGHGESWGIMINELNTWLANQGYDGQIKFVGGNDIETTWDFGPPNEAWAWVDGYSSTASSVSLLYNYGAANGCPENYPPTEPEVQYQWNIDPQECPTENWPPNVEKWDQEDVYHVSWGSLRAYPFPEIYNTLGANAQQWYRIALYAKFEHGTTMEFRGTLSQFTACLQEPDPCYQTNNTAEAGHTQLYAWLSSDPYNRVKEPLYWISDLMWYYGNP